MSYFFFFLSLPIAALDWLAVARGWRRIEYFAKPAVMVALLVWVGVNAGFRGPMLWFALGLLFSLGGDVFLMLPREQFIPGLVSFLIGHLCYLVGFNSTSPTFGLPSLILLLVVILAGYQIYRRIAAGLDAGGKSKLKIPILIYSIVISLMLFSAVSTLIQPDWRISAAAFASCGAILFFISDTLLAWNRFVAPLPNGRVKSIVPYHVGQLLITLGAAFRFLV